MAIRKKFFDIELPLLNKEVRVLAVSKDKLNNQTIKLDLTRILKGKSLEATFKIKLEGDKPIGEVKKLIIMPYFIKRAIRKSTDYVEDSFSSNCQDGVIRLKPFMITRKRVSRKVRKAIRESAEKYLKDYTGDKKIDEITREILSGKLQKTLQIKLKKIYPLGFCELRQTIIEDIHSHQRETPQETEESPNNIESKKEQLSKDEPKEEKEKTSTKKVKEEPKKKTKTTRKKADSKK